MRPSAALTVPPPGRRGGAHHAFSIAVIAAGGRSPQSFAALRIVLSPVEGHALAGLKVALSEVERQ